MAEKAHKEPAWLRRSFFTHRRVMPGFLPEALVMGEAPAYAFRPRASANRVRSSPISASTLGTDLDAEAGKAEDDLSVRMLRKSLFDRLGQVVGGGAGCLELDQEREHLLAERVLDPRRLVCPVGTENRPEPFGLGCGAALAAGSPLEVRKQPLIRGAGCDVRLVRFTGR